MTKGSRDTLRMDSVVLLAIGIAYYFVFAVLVRRTGTPDLYPRFWAPILLGSGLSIVFLVAHQRRSSLWKSRSMISLLQIAIVLSTAWFAPNGVWSRLTDFGSDLTDGSIPKALTNDRFIDVRHQYANIRNNIPPGSSVLSAVQYPHLLLSRNFRLLTMDIATANAPNGEFPVDGNLAEQINWLGHQHVDFLIVHSSNTGSCLYSISAWSRNIGANNTYGDWEPYVRSWIEFTIQLPLLATPLISEGDTMLFAVAELVSSIEAPPNGAL